MSINEAEILIKHLRELEYVVTDESPGHPHAWKIEFPSCSTAGTLYALESGRILDIQRHLSLGVGKILADVFGPDWKTLAQVCGGQAPTIGRIVHVWFGDDSPRKPAPGMISHVYDDGDIDTAEGSRNEHIPYGAFNPNWPVSFWTWPRQVR